MKVSKLALASLMVFGLAAFSNNNAVVNAQEEEVADAVEEEEEEDPFTVVPEIDDPESINMPDLGEDAEEHKFGADVKQVMDIVINSLYQNKDVFLRELISNASDALDKIRFLSLTDQSVLGDTPEMEMRITFDKEAKTITIRDTGVGMTRNELVENLGTVAKSGTTNFVNAAGGKTGELSNQIGQFGVGFYSSFLVASRVQVASKHNDEESQFVWQSDAKGDFSVSTDPRGNTLGRGSEITLFIKEKEKTDFLDEGGLERIIKRYSEFVTFPILLYKEKIDYVEIPLSEEEAADEAEDIFDEDKDDEDGVEDEPVIAKTKTEKVVTYEYERVNEERAIWARPKDTVKDEDYQAFFKTVAKGYATDPMRWIHFDAEGSVNFKSILFLPDEKGADLMSPIQTQDKNGLKLYVRNVLINDEFKDLMPKWMNFIKGVVDSDDLSLNVNRETLQHNKIIQSVGKKCQQKSIAMMKNLAKEPMPEPDLEDDDDEEDIARKSKLMVHPYIKFWKLFGQQIKWGVIDDYSNRDKLTKLLRYTSSKSDGELISMDDYVSRMKEWQTQIFFITALSEDEAKESPFLGKFNKKDVEVLYLTEPIDEWTIPHLRDYDGKSMTLITKDGVVIGDEDEDLEEKRKKFYKKKFTGLTKRLKEIYGKKVSKIKISNIAEGDAALFVSSKHGGSANADRIMRGQSFQNTGIVIKPKIMEINPRHPFITKLLALLETDPDSDETMDAAWMLYDTTCMNTGYEIENIATYTSRMHRVVQHMLDIDSIVMEEEINPPMDDSDDEDDDDEEDEFSHSELNLNKGNKVKMEYD